MVLGLVHVYIGIKKLAFQLCFQGADITPRPNPDENNEEVSKFHEHFSAVEA